MYRVPSSLRRSKKENTRLNLIPILDSVFIFIFFLLVSANFVNLKELSSDVPILSDAKPNQEKPLALTVKISNKKISFYRDLETKFIESFNYEQTEQIHKLLTQLKESFPQEKTIIFEPEENTDYEKIIQVMDLVKSDKDENLLFDNIVFSNIGDES